MYGIVYLLTSPSNKYYVGQTTYALERRWRGHIRDSKRFNSRINGAILKYGPENFEHDIIAECPDKAELDRLEKFWIQTLNTRDEHFGYNLKEGGSYGKHSEESNEKNRKAHVGRPLSAEHKTKIAGYRHTEEEKQKMRLASKRGKPMLGKKHSDEAKEKMSLAHAGVPKSPEHRKAIAAANTGKHHSQETKDKISLTKFLKTVAWG